MIITVLGLASVGKTTLIKRIFFSRQLEDLAVVRPTIFKEHTNINPTWIEENINIIDLAGQDSYLPLHTDAENFNQSDIIIFVSDVQEINRLTQTKNYYSDVAKILVEQKNISQIEIAYFIHKYDPKERIKLKENLSEYIHISEVCLEELNPTIFLTSIYDNSLYNAFITLIMRKFYDQIINFSLATINPLTWDLATLKSKSETESYLFDIGKKIGLDLREKWVETILKGDKIAKTPEFLDYKIKLREKSKSSFKINLNLMKIPKNEYLNSEKVFQTFFKAFISPLSLTAEFQLKNNNLGILIKSKKVKD